MHHPSGNGRRHKHDIRDERDQWPEVLDVAGACDICRTLLFALVLAVRLRRDVQQDVGIRCFRRLDD
eukprot:3668998-Pleurochrysis_carterae.AAC.1